MSVFPGTAGYPELASHFLSRRLSFEQVHEPFLHLIPQLPSRILDIGSGPGHDADTFAARGHTVVAVEPTDALRLGAAARYRSSRIRWVADGLPRLGVTRALGERFDFVLMSGVWMHLSEPERHEAMPQVVGLMAPGGVLALSLRHGPVPHGRRMFPVSAQETTALAAAAGLEPVVTATRDSIQAANRAAGVRWTLLAFRN